MPIKHRRGTSSYLSVLAQSLPSRSRVKDRNRNKSPVNSPYQGENEKENIYFQCLKHGYLPPKHNRIFSGIYEKISKDYNFAWKCIYLAIHSRNEEIVKAILSEIPVSKKSFSKINENVYDKVIEEAVQLDDLETIISIIEWRADLAADLMVTEVDLKLMRYQKRALALMVSACIKNNFRKMLLSSF